MAPSRSSKAPPPLCHYPLLGQATAVLCGLDMLITTLLLLCNTGRPVFSDFGIFLQSQVGLLNTIGLSCCLHHSMHMHGPSRPAAG